MCGAMFPGGYRNTINDNVVLIEMIETLDGAVDAREIAAIPGVTAIFAASGDLGNFSGYKQGSPDYERLINVVHDAALARGQAAVRSVRLARPARLHLLPECQRDGRHRARRCRRTRAAEGHARQARSRTLRAEEIESVNAKAETAVCRRTWPSAGHAGGAPRHGTASLFCPAGHQNCVSSPG